MESCCLMIRFHTFLRGIATSIASFNSILLKLFTKCYLLYGVIYALKTGVHKRCRLSWLTHSALVYEPKCLTELWKSISIFNLWLKRITDVSIKKPSRSRDTVTYSFQICGHAAKCGSRAGREGHQTRDSQTQVQFSASFVSKLILPHDMPLRHGRKNY
jgi:hypothetical protein